MKETKDVKENNRELLSVVLIVLIALAFAAAASYAWFSISDTGRLSNLRLEITTGKSLRFDLEAHDDFEEYRQSLDFDSIVKKIRTDRKTDLSQTVLEPVTTSDGRNFYYEDGTQAVFEEGNYYEFTLHFRANTSMLVHLTSRDSQKTADGTRVNSSNPLTPAAMRISFQEKEKDCIVYDPGKAGGADKIGGMKVFGLFGKNKMEYNEDNLLFAVPENTDVPVTVRIWVEGTDEACSNEIKESDFSIQLRFEGTDENGELLN